jgi:uncharacterized membrane protein YbhN (UPF0104 family)
MGVAGQTRRRERSPVWRHVRRAVLLAVTGVSLYLLAPSLLTLFDAWPQLKGVRPWWFVVVVGLQAASFVCLWALMRIALRTSGWFEVASSQLAGNAASRIVPGGAATGTVVQASMLINSGLPATSVGGALGAAGLLTTGMLLALPVLAVPAVLAGAPLAHELELGLVFSLALAITLVGLGFAVLKWDRVVHVLARGVGWLLARVLHRGSPAGVAARVLTERDRVAQAFEGRWLRSLAAAAGNRMFDYATLVAALVAVGAHVRPSLVLVAYVASLALGLVPITPGGLGFVETGLTSLLVLAGASTDQALAATLLYRLASFWLPIPVGAVAWAGWRARPRDDAEPA